MSELNIEYKLGLEKGTYIIGYDKLLEEGGKIGIICNCPNKNEIYLFGQETEPSAWLWVLVHEEYHAIFHLLEIESKYHHTLMDVLL